MKNLTLLFLILLFQLPLFSQVDNTLQLCDKHISPPFVSDGQEYRAMLNGEEVAEFNVTFYGGSTYRVVGCSGMADGNLLFSIYDKERNIIFSNKDYENSPYWDFKVKNTVNLIIEAELKQTEENSGFAFLQIGFKQ